MPEQPRILIIDDCPEDRERYRRLLNPFRDRSGSFGIVEAGSGAEGLRQYRTQSPDCILLDYSLPDVNGLEFLAELKAEKGGAAIPVVMLTGQGNEVVAVQAMKEGAQDYLIKSDLNAESLRRALQNAMEKVALRRQLEAHRRELERLATTDSLTGLFNRSILLQRFEQEVQRFHRYGSPLCVVLFDLDDFKQINDSYGHLAGDQVLGWAGQLLRSELRNTDIAGRYGGDEFCVVLPETGLEPAEEIAERLRASFADKVFAPSAPRSPFARGVSSFRVTCSVGLVQPWDFQQSVTSLLKLADQALYRAKKAGRNQVWAATRETLRAVPGNEAGANGPEPVRVLIVDDCAEDRELFRRFLTDDRDCAYSVSESDSGAEGLALCRSEHPDCVLLDYRLPDLTGLEFLSELKEEQGAGVPAVMLTGHGNEMVAAQAMKNGAKDYLVKGQVSREELRRAIDHAREKVALKRKHARQRRARAGLYARERFQRSQLEHVVRVTEDKLRIAHEIQRQLLPQTTPVLAGFDLGAASRSADATGGDYFDYLAMPDGALGVVIGDASGHGFGPALLISVVHAYLRALKASGAGVSEILQRANRLVVDDVKDDNFITLLLARLEPRTRTLSYSSAGHPTGYHLDAGGTLKTELKSTGPLLGIDRDSDFPAAPPLTLEAGDCVLLHTDGIVSAEAPDGRCFGAARMLEVVRSHQSKPAAEIVNCLLDAVAAFSSEVPADDDRTALVIKAE